MFGWLGPDPIDRWCILASLLEDLEAEERIERAWLRSAGADMTHRRRRWSERALLDYPLTQPKDACQRCLAWTGDEDEAWQLDHIVELAVGGLDHPSNLLRLCDRCHRDKPYPRELRDDQDAWRLAIIRWVQAGPTTGRSI